MEAEPALLIVGIGVSFCAVRERRVVDATILRFTVKGFRLPRETRGSDAEHAVAENDGSHALHEPVGRAPEDAEHLGYRARLQ